MNTTTKLHTQTQTKNTTGFTCVIFRGFYGVPVGAHRSKSYHCHKHCLSSLIVTDCNDIEEFKKKFMQVKIFVTMYVYVKDV